jgi:hypothetical protein
MDRIRVIFHSAPAPDNTGQVVIPDPIVLGDDPEFVMRWIRRRLGLRARGPFPLTTRYGKDVLPLRDPAAMVSLGVPKPSERPADTVIPEPAGPTPLTTEPDASPAVPLAPAAAGAEPETAMPITAVSSDESANSSLPSAPVLADEV